ncbi:Protein of unknown function DUF4406 [uncultured Caudovirales phage]|uniref:DUF6378 domain-containing protein n=1 Tax=uncultured Caudovirales phage TaxID=2100421 RepID=A0A6J7XC75_9CAUD|nr:Protein of unknown function DUF4406 [uncultured Caudovirales phage]CAB4199169.1 Protein of unknown function DUF4406 [uncultured Caudovirales phage]CAB5228435.1 Protein of unknown function DUF4406 [uncultured Caudovirales phage]
MKKEHVYVAGPMSGIPDFNYPAFRAASKDLRERGYVVTDPVEIDDQVGVVGIIDDAAGLISARGWVDCLSRDIQILCDPEISAVVVLPGWEKSKGAKLEVHVARTLGKRIFSYPELNPVLSAEDAPKETILEEASRLVEGDRGDDYGHPRDDFARTAGAWKAIFGWECSPAQVALAMIVVKLSRLHQTPLKRDSVVDIAGYARTYEMVLDREKADLRHYPTEIKPKENLPATVSIFPREDNGQMELDLRHNFLKRREIAEREGKTVQDVTEELTNA